LKLRTCFSSLPCMLHTPLIQSPSTFSV
jgi:hypothetical protein